MSKLRDLAQRVKELEQKVFEYNSRIWALENPCKYKIGDTIQNENGEDFIVANIKALDIFDITYKVTLVNKDTGRIYETYEGSVLKAINDE
jgi:hypothetical protein